MDSFCSSTVCWKDFSLPIEPLWKNELTMYVWVYFWLYSVSLIFTFKCWYHTSDYCNCTLYWNQVVWVLQLWLFPFFRLFWLSGAHRNFTWMWRLAFPFLWKRMLKFWKKDCTESIDLNNVKSSYSWTQDILPFTWVLKNFFPSMFCSF